MRVFKQYLRLLLLLTTVVIGSLKLGQALRGFFSNSNGDTGKTSVSVIPDDGKYALIIAVDKYADPKNDLKGCVNDANDLATALINNARFPKDNVTVMTFKEGDEINDPNAPTADHIYAKISELVSKVKSNKDESNAFLWVSFIGHGGEASSSNNTSKSFQFFCPCVANDKSKFVNLSRVLYELENSNAKYLFVTGDTCRTDLSVDDDELRNCDKYDKKRKYINLKDKQGSGLQLWSCSFGQSSLEFKGNGIFTRILIDGLSGKAVNEETGELTLEALCSYVRAETPKRSEPLFQNINSRGASGQQDQTPTQTTLRGGELTKSFMLVDNFPISGTSWEIWKKAEGLYKEADGLFKKGKLSKAKKKIDEALELLKYVPNDVSKKAKYLVKQWEIEKIIAKQSNPPTTNVDPATVKRSETLLQEGIERLFGMNNKEKINVEDGIAALKESANLGNLRAQAILADVYFCGYGGVAPNVKKAFKLAQAPAEKNFPEALETLGKYYYRACLEPNDLEKGKEYLSRAFAEYEKLAKAEDALAQNNLGCLYCSYLVEALEKTPDYEKALEWLKKSADQGNAKAQNNLATLKLRRAAVDISEKDALEWAKKAVEQGLTDGYYTLGLFEQNSVKERDGDVQIKETAFELMEKAAGKGCMSAMIDVAYRFYNGIGAERDYEKAKFWIGRAVDNLIALAATGDPDAQFYLGLLYAEGFGTEQDAKIAFDWFSKAAEAGNCCAINMLGRYAQMGTVGDAEEKKAFEYYTKSAERGCPHGAYNLAYCCHNGIGTPEDLQSAVEYYKKSVDLCENIFHYLTCGEMTEAQIALGNFYLNGAIEGDEKNVFDCFYKAKEARNCFVKRMLGWCYLNGKGVDKNAETAFNYYSEAVNELDCAMSAYELGYCYEYGVGTCENLKQAFDYYSKAVELSKQDSDSRCYSQRDVGKFQFTLGRCYTDGLYVQENPDEATRLFSDAAKNGYCCAYAMLGRYYYWDNYSMKDDEKAFKYAQKAAALGCRMGTVFLGNCFLRGIGTSANLEQACKCYQIAFSDKVDPNSDCYMKEDSTFPLYLDAQYQTGCFFEKGEVVEQNSETAFDWFSKAANAGHSCSNTKLGDYYLKGIGGCKQDKEKAFTSFEKAAELGCEAGICGLAFCYEKGIGTTQDMVKAREYYASVADRESHNCYCASNEGLSLTLYYLGTLFKDERNYGSAYEWFSRAANMGHCCAYNALGNLYLNGDISEEEDQCFEFKYFEQAASSGCGTGACNLGYCYDEGIGTPKDIELARNFYLIAAESNDHNCYCRTREDISNAQYNLGMLSEAEKEYEDAFDWFSKAAEANDCRAINKLGEYCQKGLFVPKDEKRAFEYYQESTNLECEDGAYNLGMCYRYNIGTDANPELAFENFTLAVERGNTSAYSELEIMYREGIGIPKDLKKADEYKRLAEEAAEEDEDSIKSDDAIPTETSEESDDVVVDAADFFL